MNRQNIYFEENDFFKPQAQSFERGQHSSIHMCTKTIYTEPNVELFKNSSFPNIIFTTHTRKRIEDPVKKWIDMKQEYVNNKSKIETRLINLYKLKKISRKEKIIRKDIKDYILYKFMDPKPYVDLTEGFCFYPHHGTLRTFETEKSDYLAHIVDNDKISFNEISPNMPLKKYNHVHDSSSPPLELLCDENSNFALIRNLKEVKLARIQDNNNETIETFDKFKHKSDIFASSLRDCHLTTIDSKYILRRFNLEYTFEDLNIKLTDYFIDDKLLPVSLNNLDKSNSVSITTKDALSIIDFRNKKKIVFESPFTSNNRAFNCEKIFNHSNSRLNKNTVYIATSHLLYTFDYRMTKQPVVHWTHQLYKPPMMITTTEYGLTEIICLSNHTVGDMKLFNNNGDSVNYYGFRPKNINNTYNELREQGLFLLSDDINERVKASVTGVTLYADPINSHVKLYTQNYFGDIFESTLNCKDGQCTNDVSDAEIECFENWKTILDVPLNPNEEINVKELLKNGDLIVDNIVKFDNLPKYLGSDECIDDLTELEVENVPKVPESWKVDINAARQCNDLLSKEIMFLWEDIDDDNYAEDDEQQEDRNKVSMWLKEQSFNQEEKDEFDELTLVEPSFSQVQANSTTLNISSLRRKSRVTGF